MRNWLFFGLATVSILLYQNCSATHESIDGAVLGSEGGTTLNDVDMAKSLAAYQNTLYPITQEEGSCVDCHGVDQQPLHSMADVAIAHDVMISFGLVNLRNPANSVIVQKLNGGHQGFDATFQQRILDAVVAWSDELIANGGLIGVGDGVQPIYSSLFTNLFEAKCLSCHAPGEVAEDIDYSDYVTTINTGQVIPGNASGSPITGYNGATHEPTGSAPMLSAEERAALTQWINLGALNN